MINIEELIEEYKEEGYSERNAEARVCQDIVLKAIKESGLSKNVTIKGGVVMRNLTNDVRRATQDIDLDFIRYSLDEKAIYRFVDELNCIEGISIRINGQIEELSQQEYRGKRIKTTIEDNNGNTVFSKIDLGVHKNLQIDQEDYCFDIFMDNEGVYLLANSKEQIFAEKLRALLKFGALSTRYKDVYDLCYLCEYVEKEKLMDCINVYIFSDSDMRESNITDIRNRLDNTFSNTTYIEHLESTKKADWLGIQPATAIKRIEDFLECF